MTPDTPAFQAWAGTSKQMVIGRDMTSHNWNQEGPHLLCAFHGTTHDFDRFSLERSTHMGQFGRVHYFTSCVIDADANYASEDGPDLKMRIGARSEAIENEIADDPEDAGLLEDATAEDIQAQAQKLARAELLGNAPQVHELYLRLNRPFVIDASGATDRPMFEEQFNYSDAVQAVADENDISFDEVEENIEAYEDRVYEVLDDAQMDVHETLSQGLIMASYQVGFETPNLPDFIAPLSEITCNRFEEYFKQDEDISCAENEEGEFVSSSLFSIVLEHLGYDSIVLLNADRRFKTMNMMQQTTHIHLMGSARSQVKSFENSGSFNPEDPNIYT